uniref:Leucine rich repeat containing 32 n=1 Tax=Aquila chrysaetos chrysaetos TaxID=223781 RepID=A0A663EXL1_AQUCH
MEIEKGAFEALEELEVVNLALNSLHCISGFSLTQLRVLNLSHNALELFVSEEAAEPYLLQVLDLSHNRLLYFPELPKAHYLTHLNLSNNLIASLLPGSRHPGEFVLHYKEMARFNRTSRTAAGLTHVADLDLSNNRLQLFPFTFFHSLGSLHSLSLAMNCLQDIAGESLANGMEPSDRSSSPPEHANLSVRSLDLHGNAIHVLPRWFFDSLQGSDQGGNLGGGSRVPAPGGTCTPFYNVPRLKHLSLCNNNITRLHPYAFNRTSLLSLDLSGNKDLSVPKEALGGLEFSLQKLSLRGNQMDNSKTELPCLDTLKVLDLSGNNLSLLPTGLLCSPLESLDVRNNNLLMLEKLALVSWSHSLKDVSVAGNPFSCCSLAWLDVLQAAGVGVRDLDEDKKPRPGLLVLICHPPEPIAGCSWKRNCLHWDHLIGLIGQLTTCSCSRKHHPALRGVGSGRERCLVVGHSAGVGRGFLQDPAYLSRLPFPAKPSSEGCCGVGRA